MAYIQSKTGMRILVDDHLYNELNEYKWNINANGHAYTQIDSKPVTMHHYLLDIPKGLTVFRRNLKPLDNRLENLEVVTHKELIQKRNEILNAREKDTNGYFPPLDLKV